MNLPLVVLNIAGAAALLIWAVGWSARASSGRMARHCDGSCAASATTAPRGGNGNGHRGAAPELHGRRDPVGGFAASGLLGTATGLALLLGADLGSALVVRILSLDLGWLTPALMVTGVALFLKSGSRAVRQTGRS